MRDRSELEEIAERLLAAGIRELFVPAGDAAEPGEFAGAAELLEAMGPLRARFDEIGITGYPETHHLISDEETIQAMFAKAPMATCIISQICFDAGVIAAWIAEVRRRGVGLPIWIGLPGTVDYAKLVRISMKIGLGESARFLRHHSNWMSRLVTRQFKPDPLMRGPRADARRPGREHRRLPPLHVQRGRPHRALAARGARAARRLAAEAPSGGRGRSRARRSPRVRRRYRVNGISRRQRRSELEACARPALTRAATREPGPPMRRCSKRQRANRR